MFDKKAKYLEFVQDIISRMASCSFKCKEFCILMCAGLLTVYATIDNHPTYILFICDLPILIFWALDAYYLNQERGFRNLYKEKAKITDLKKFDDYNISPIFVKRSYLKTFFSKTIWPLYFILLAAATISGIILL